MKFTKTKIKECKINQAGLETSEIRIYGQNRTALEFASENVRTDVPIESKLTLAINFCLLSSIFSSQGTLIQ